MKLILFLVAMLIAGGANAHDSDCRSGDVLFDYFVLKLTDAVVKIEGNSDEDQAFVDYLRKSESDGKEVALIALKFVSSFNASEFEKKSLGGRFVAAAEGGGDLWYPVKFTINTARARGILPQSNSIELLKQEDAAHKAIIDLFLRDEQELEDSELKKETSKAVGIIREIELSLSRKDFAPLNLFIR